MRCRKCYFDGCQVEIVAELVDELETDGRQLRLVKLTDYTAEEVRTASASLTYRSRPRLRVPAPSRCRNQKRLVNQRTGLAAGRRPNPQAGTPALRQRTPPQVIMRREFHPADGALQFTLTDVLKVPTISRHGVEINQGVETKKLPVIAAREVFSATIQRWVYG